MKALKIAVLSFLSIFIILYTFFLFILPYCIDLNQYSPQITKIIQEKAGIDADIDGLSVKTAWNLSAGALINKVDLKDTNGIKFAQVNNLQIRLSLLPLLFKKVKIDKIEADKVLANVYMQGHCYINNLQSEKTSTATNGVSAVHLINIKKYRISLLDKNNNYTIKGDNLILSDFTPGKKIKLKSKGELILNKRKQITYNVNLFSSLISEQNAARSDKVFEYITILNDLYKYNINADINADLKIKNKSDIDGKIDINKLTFVFANKSYPQSDLKLAFRDSSAKIISTLNVDNNSKINIDGILKTGRNKFIDLKVKSNEIQIKDILQIVRAMSKPFGIKNLQNIEANGGIKADFRIKSDFKKVESDGYLNIKNTKVIDKTHNVILSSLNSDIDFSQNSINIINATAKLNNEPIIIKGNIDKNANATITVLADNLQFKSLLFASGNSNLLQDNDVLGGKANVKVILNGRLNKAVPEINILINNANLRNRKTKSCIKIAKININAKNKQGIITINNFSANTASSLSISAPILNLSFNEKELNIEKTYLYINNIKTSLSGAITNLKTTPTFNQVLISVPNQISVPIKGYSGSHIVLKGDLTINGTINNPKLKGLFNIPSVKIPSVSTSLKDATLQISDEIIFSCPNIQAFNSIMKIRTVISKDFSSGIVAKNVDFAADTIDLNNLIPAFKSNGKKSSTNLNLPFTILNGKNFVRNFMVGRFLSSNITSNISFKNNILYLDNLRADAYLGKVGGSVNYDFLHKKTALNLQGRGLCANPALFALTGKDNKINGQLDFDSNISMRGFSKGELLPSLKGYSNFIISNGQMGVLGKFEHLLYAQNVISNNIFKASLNLVAKALTVKNTGVYKYMKGKITFSNGWANITQIRTSGPTMSLYMTGRLYLPENIANLTILGRISDDVVRVLGPIGEFSVDKAISSIPGIGEVSTFFASQFTTNPDYENTSQIPYLTPKTELPTKEFKVVIDGELDKQSSVKSFKWLSRPKVNSNYTPQNYVSPTQFRKDAALPDFVDRLPELKN